MLAKHLLALALPVLAAAISVVETKGNAFFYKDTGERFYMRGLAYQPGGPLNLYDPLADPTVCLRDIEYFKDLGINTIRVYSIDNTASHDECMLALADAGIYLVLDTNTPLASIARDSGANCLYNTMYLNEVFATVKLMSQYNNTLGFFAANEVINDDSTTAAAAQVKAVVRDIKNFQRNTGLRTIPVGYSAADVELNRVQLAHYFNCGDDEMARVDMYGFNDYSWCGRLTYQRLGYADKVAMFSNYSIPLFFSEYGCNEVSPRVFTEVEAIYLEAMTSTFSGGLAYEYTEEDNEYGLVVVLANGNITVKPDYNNLRLQFANVSNPTGDGNYSSSLPPSNCPALSSHWNATNDIPSTPLGALKYVKGDAEPSGTGFDAITQWACIDAANLVDDLTSLGDGSNSNSSSSNTGSGSGSGSSLSSSNDAMEMKASRALWVILAVAILM